MQFVNMKPDGPAVLTVGLHADDRGYVYCPLDNLDELGIKRTYVVENHNIGMIRAWHGHRKADTYMHVIRGAVKLAALNMDDHDKIMVRTLTERSPQILYVPAGWYNGAQSLTAGTKILVYSTLTFDDVKHDDERLPWDAKEDVWKVVNR